MGRLLEKYREIIAYAFWGMITTAVCWGSYSVFALLLGQYQSTFHILGMEFSTVIFVANILSWVCAVSFAFVVNKMWVFNSRSWEGAVVLPELGKFVTARLTTGIIEIVGVPFLVSCVLDQAVFGIEGIAAKVAVTALVLILNYVFSKLLIFRKV